MEVYDGSLNILLMVFLISEKDIELRLARQHQLNLIRFKQFQILFAISTCTPKAVPYTAAIQETHGNMKWKYGYGKLDFQLFPYSFRFPTLIVLM